MPVLIKRYANRKLYNTESSRYITLKGISELVRDGREIRVIDNESGEEITPIILSQILVDDQKSNREPSGGVPGNVLAELVQRSGDALYTILRRSMEDVNENLSEARERARRWMQHAGEAAPLLDPAELTGTIHEAVERVMRVADLPTRGDLEALNKNVERLAAALESLEARLSNSPKPGS